MNRLEWFIFRLKLLRFRLRGLESPLVTAKKHHEAIAELQKIQRRDLQRLAEEKEQVASMVDELLPRLARVNIDRRKPEERLFRIIITMDEMLIQQSFLWGNEDREIRFVAERIGYEIARELVGINKSRLIRDYPHQYFDGDTW